MASSQKSVFGGAGTNLVKGVVPGARLEVPMEIGVDKGAGSTWGKAGPSR